MRLGTDADVASTSVAATEYVVAKCELVTVADSMLPVRMLPHVTKNVAIGGDLRLGTDDDVGIAAVATL